MKSRHSTALAVPGIAIPLLCIALAAGPARANDITSDELFGRSIYVTGGSSVQVYIKPIVIKPYSRQKIEFGYVHSISGTGSTGISFADEDDRFIATISYVMINCVDRTYSPYPRPETNMGRIAYYSASDHPWDQTSPLGFDSTEHVRNDVKTLFEDACALSEKF